MEYREMEKSIKKIVDSMPDRRKQIFRLSREEGFSNKEIAEKLNISKNTVENQLVTALKNH